MLGVDLPVLLARLVESRDRIADVASARCVRRRRIASAVWDRCGGRVGAVRIEPADDAMFGERDAWRYEPPYDFYDSDGLPVKNPEFFFAARDDDRTLIGFYFLEPRDGALFYGFGMRPDLTGRGLGEQFVLAGLEFARVLYGAHRVVLDVAAFNERAIRLYRRLGFDETGRHVETFDGYGVVEFIDMEKLDGEKPG
jgi:RimJ/RimL family protein N-acetyltransferase